MSMHDGGTRPNARRRRGWCWRAIAAGVVLLAGPATGLADAQVAAGAPAVVGDSLIVGAEQFLPSSWFVDAHNGRALFESIGRLGQRPVRNATCVVVALGSNDVSHRRSAARQVRDIQLASAKLAGHSCVLWPSVKVEGVAYYGPGWRAAALQWNRLIERHGVGEVIDWNAEASRHREYFLGDGLHMTRAGRAAYARYLRSAVRSHLASSATDS
jgi:hypothetical protein